ncbi:acyl-CoA N-acyltransferase [Hypoxylon sp. FL1150]|nr:acyl-CoA N-acyltransferase [Hypoxylon sp. FL1150]
MSDVKAIVQYVLVPARKTSAYRTMFPGSGTMTEAQTEELFRWYTDILEDKLWGRWEGFLKTCSPDGTPVSFCGWAVEAMDGRAGDEPNVKESQMEFWAPKYADIGAWTSLAADIEVMMDRVLEGHSDICCIEIMTVNPEYQDQGISSSMVQRICEHTDQHGSCPHVITGPGGVQVYEVFDFKIVGHVETSHGNITSMFRPSRSQQS